MHPFSFARNLDALCVKYVIPAIKKLRSAYTTHFAPPLQRAIRAPLEHALAGPLGVPMNGALYVLSRC